LQARLIELNSQFALMLDTCPVTDLSGQPANDYADENHLGIVLAWSSHSVWLMDHLESANLLVDDSTVPGFRITEASVKEMTTDLAETTALFQGNQAIQCPGTHSAPPAVAGIDAVLMPPT
jgi:hypothetical protein